MRKLILLSLLIVSACMPAEEMPDPSPNFMEVENPEIDESSNLVAEGDFINGAHETSGNVKVKSISGGER